MALNLPDRTDHRPRKPLHSLLQSGCRIYHALILVLLVGSHRKRLPRRPALMPHSPPSLAPLLRLDELDVYPFLCHQSYV